MTGRDLTSAFVSLVGAAHVRPASPSDLIRGVMPHLIVEPANEQEVAAVLRAANDAGVAVIPRGGGTKMDWGNPPARADVVLSMRRLDRVVDHAWADLTLDVESGCGMAALQRTLAAHGQRVAIDALWPDHATVGGILASNDSGALRLRFGGLRDLIIGITLALPDGTRATSGGRVVKNVAGYDLPKLATGAFGTLGVITRAIFRLHPLPRGSRTISIGLPDLAAAQRIIELIQDSRLAHTALQLRARSSEAPSVDVLFEGSDAGMAAASTQLRALIGAIPTSDVAVDVWQARERLWNADAGGTILKLSVPMTDIAATLERVRPSTPLGPGRWRGVFYATGLGWVAMAPDSGEASHDLVERLREWAGARGGSAVVLRSPPAVTLDSWGSFGDAEPLMREVRRQFDPAATLNPGRFIDPA
jgi:glycolate oxidase FAD binding subunit